MQVLADRFAALTNSMRQAVETFEGFGDAVTEDLFTEGSRGLDKALWFLEAHLQAYAGRKLIWGNVHGNIRHFGAGRAKDAL